MEHYFKLNNSLDIPVAFQFPGGSPWPTWSWQQKLGNQIINIRTGTMSLTEEEKDVLESYMDFKWGPKGRALLNVRINVIKQNESLLSNK